MSAGRYLSTGISASSVTSAPPAAPTTNVSTWRTGDLAAHLVVREHSVLAAAGIFIPQLAPVTVRAMARVRRRPFPAVVDRIRHGGLLPREGRLGEALHLLEFVVHREDILRASSDLAVPDATRRDAGLEDAVFEQLRRSARALGLDQACRGSSVGQRPYLAG